MSDANHPLGGARCLAFPFRVGSDGPATSARDVHVREQIEQVLFTTPGERVFRPDFGAGLKVLVFEPNDVPLWELTRRRIQATLAEALRGEADPDSLQVEVAPRGDGEILEVVVRYRLLALGVSQVQRFALEEGSRG